MDKNFKPTLFKSNIHERNSSGFHYQRQYSHYIEIYIYWTVFLVHCRTCGSHLCCMHIYIDSFPTVDLHYNMLTFHLMCQSGFTGSPEKNWYKGVEGGVQERQRERNSYCKTMTCITGLVVQVWSLFAVSLGSTRSRTGDFSSICKHPLQQLLDKISIE